MNTSRAQVPFSRMEKTVTGARSTKTVMLVGLTVVGLTMGLPRYAQAQSGVGVVTTLVGEATVARVAAPQPQALKKLDNVFPLDRITTRERSVVHVLMGGKALLTVRELSVVTITEEGGRSTVDLQSGKVGLAVVHEKMRPGDVIDVYRTLCLLEAMKTFSTLSLATFRADDTPLFPAGNYFEVVRVVPENGQAVNRDDLLFVIRPAADGAVPSNSKREE